MLLDRAEGAHTLGKRDSTACSCLASPPCAAANTRRHATLSRSTTCQTSATAAAPYPPGQYRRTRQATSSSRFATTDSSSVLRSSEHTTTEAHKGHSNPNHNGAPTVASWFLRHTLNSCLPSTGRRQRQVLPTFAPRYAALASSSMQQHARHNQPASAGAAGGGPVLTVRAIAAGLLVGSVLCFSNTYFGLQTGWVTMGSLQVNVEMSACGVGYSLSAKVTAQS